MTAADNIARGIVHEREQLGQYGAVIVNQARRLTEFVEQVLLFASTRNATHRTVLQPVDISEVIDTTLDASADLLQASRVAVETGIDADLPSVMADPFWLSQCLQNLITNALKYSGGEPWLGIRASLAHTRSGNEIQIAVSDRGIGIARPSSDMSSGPSTAVPLCSRPGFRGPAWASRLPRTSLKR